MSASAGRTATLGAATKGADMAAEKSGSGGSSGVDDTRGRGSVSATSPQYIAAMALALMTVSSVASLRPAPTMAVYGLACVFLYLLPAIVFLVPTALVSAELASGWSGGVYRWVTEGISPNMGFAAAWHQFAMTIFYYPTPRTHPAVLAHTRERVPPLAHMCHQPRPRPGGTRSSRAYHHEHGNAADPPGRARPAV
ncbi:hypothetical protein [Pseudonocardia sp.]|uniref:hypothetical protein n=1 Tax=Pseudonocardia sp. TaxID=60912 RepID=UPI003D113697